MWRSEAYVGCLLLLPTLLRQGLLPNQGLTISATQAGQQVTRILQLMPPQCYAYRRIPCFYMAAKDLNSVHMLAWQTLYPLQHPGDDTSHHCLFHFIPTAHLRFLFTPLASALTLVSVKSRDSESAFCLHISFLKQRVWNGCWHGVGKVVGPEGKKGIRCIDTPPPCIFYTSAHSPSTSAAEVSCTALLICTHSGESE